MDIFFDVDQTILGMDYSLRPGAAETMAALVEMGHRVHLWSGMGVRSDVAERHKLTPLLSGLYRKPLYDYVERLEECGVPLEPGFVVDDDPQVVTAFGGLWVRPYYAKDPCDGAMARVLCAATDYAARGESADPHFRHRGVFRPFTGV